MASSAPICKVCNQVITGLDMVFDDSGAGVVVTRCPRCHHLSHHLDEVAIQTFHKHAGTMDSIKGALTEIGPAVAALGIWDVMVAYNTFKKVMNNTLRLQERQKSPLYSPFWAEGKAKLADKMKLECMECGRKFSSNSMEPKCPKCGGYDIEVAAAKKEAAEESYEGEEDHRRHLREIVKGSYLEQPMEEVLALRGIDAFSAAAGLHWYLVHYHGGQSSEEYRMLSQLEYRPGMGEMDIDPSKPQEGHEGDAEAYATFEEAGKKHHKMAGLEKKADDWVDNHAYKPREEIEHVTNPNPMHFEEPEDAKEVKVALSEIQNFLQAIIPHVVAYAMQQQDPEVLKALGHLGSIIRDARKTWRIARESEEEEYSRTYLANPSTDLSELIQ